MSDFFSRGALHSMGFSAPSWMEETITNAGRSGLLDYNDAEADRQFRNRQRSFEDIMNLSRQLYARDTSGNTNPDEMETRTALSYALQGAFPGMSREYVEKNIEDLMKLATGYDYTPGGMWEHLGNVVHSAGSGLLAGVSALNFLLSNQNLDDVHFEEAKTKFFEDMSTKYAMTYNSDDYLSKQTGVNKLITDALTSAAQFIPSRLPSLGIWGAAAALSIFSGGTAAPVALGAANFATTAIMEAGGLALEMMQKGFDPNVILGTVGVVGTLNGLVEVSPVGSMFERTLSNNLVGIFSKDLGKKGLNDAINHAVKNTFKNYRKDYVKSLASEPVEEVLQDLVSMFGYNFALEYQNRTGNPIDATGYSLQDIVTSLTDTAKSTFMGTAVMGAGGTALNIGANFLVGDLGSAIFGKRHTMTEGADTAIRTRKIVKLGKIGEKLADDVKVGPVPVVKIGNKYYTYNATPEQNRAVQDSMAVYAKIVKLPANMNVENLDHFEGAMSATTINNMIADALNRNLIKGFSYIDAEQNVVDDYSKATGVVIETTAEGTRPIIVDFAKKDSVKRGVVEREIFGYAMKNQTETQEKEAQTSEENKTEAETEEKKKTEEEEIEAKVREMDESINETMEDNDLSFSDMSSESLSSQLEELGIADDVNQAEETLATEEQNPAMEDTVRVDSSTTREEQTATVEQPTASETTTSEPQTAKPKVTIKKNKKVKVKPKEQVVPVATTPATQEESTTSVAETQAEATTPAVETAMAETPTIVENAEPQGTEQPAVTETATEVTEAQTPAESTEPQEGDASDRAEVLSKVVEQDRKYADAIESLGLENESAIIDVMKDRFTELFSQTEIGKRKPDSARAVGEATAVMMAGLAHAQGRTVAEFMNGLDAKFFDDIKSKANRYFSFIDPANKGNWLPSDSTYAKEIDALRNEFASVVTDKKTWEGAHVKDFFRAYKSQITDLINKYPKVELDEVKILAGIPEGDIPFAKELIQTSMLKELLGTDVVLLPRYADNIFRDIFGVDLERESIPDGIIALVDGNKYVEYKAITDEKIERRINETAKLGDTAFIVVDKLSRGKRRKIFSGRLQLTVPNGFNIHFFNIEDGNYSLLKKTKESKLELLAGHREQGSRFRKLSSALLEYIQGNDFVKNKPIDFKEYQNAHILNQELGSVIGGFYDYAKRNIGITSHGTPTTLIHEIAHHFLATIPDGAIKDSILKTFAKQAEADGGKIDTNVQEAFAHALELYIYRNKTRHSALRGLFQKLKNICGVIWDQFTTKDRLSKEQIALFDDIFDKSTYSKAVEENNARLAKKLEETDVSRSIAPTAEKAKAMDDAVKEAQAVYRTGTAQVTAENGKLTPEEKETISNAVAEKADALAEESANSMPEDETETAEEVLDLYPYEYDETTDLASLDVPKVENKEKLSASNEILGNKNNKGYAERKAAYENDLRKSLQKAIDGNKLYGYVGGNELRPTKLIDDTRVYSIMDKIVGSSLFNLSNIQILQDDYGSLYVHMTERPQATDSDQTVMRAVPEDRQWIYIPLNIDSVYSSNDNLISIVSRVLNSTDENLYDKIFEEAEGSVLLKDESYTYEPNVLADSILAEISALESLGAFDEDFNPSTVLYQTLDENDPKVRDTNAEIVSNVLVANLDSNTIISLFRGYAKLREDTLKNIRNQDADDVDFQQLHGKSEQDAVDEELAKQGIYDIVDYAVKNNTKIAEAVKNVPGLEDKLMTLFDNVAESYSMTAKALSYGFRSAGGIKRATNILKGIVAAARKNVTNATQYKDVFANRWSLDTKGLGTAWRNLFDSTKEKGASDVSVADVELILDAIVDKNGKVKNIIHENDSYTSPLIELLDKAHSISVDNSSKTETDPEYRNASLQILSNTQSIDVNLDTQMSVNFIDLASTMMKATGDGFIKGIYEGLFTEDVVNTVLNSFISVYGKNRKEFERKAKDLADKVNQLKAKEKEIEQARRTAERERDSAIARLEKEKASMSSLKESEKERLDAKIDAVRKKYDEKIAELNRKLSDEGYNDLKKEKENLQGQVSRLKRKLEEILNNPDYMTAKEIKEKYDGIYKGILTALTHAKDRWGADEAERIFRALRRKPGTELGNTFVAGHEGYETYAFRTFVQANDMVEMKDGKLVLKNNLSTLSSEKLGEFADLLKEYVASHDDDFKKAKKERDDKILDDINTIATDTYTRRESTHEELNDFKGDFKTNKENYQPDATAEVESRQKKFSLIRDFETMSTIAKDISPDLHAYLFGGMINGKYNDENLNTAQDKEAKFSTERIGKVISKIAAEFGVKEKNVGKATYRLFYTNSQKIGRISISEFERAIGQRLGSLTRTRSGKIKFQENENLGDEYRAFAWYYKKIVDHYNNDMSAWNKYESGKSNVPAQHPGDFSAYLERATGEANYNYTHSWSSLMGMYLYSKQKMALNSEIVGNNMSFGTLMYVTANMVNNPDWAKYKAVADTIQATVAERYNELAEVYHLVTGKTLDKEQFYLSIIHDGALNAIEDSLNAANTDGINFGVPSSQNGPASYMTMERHMNGHVVSNDVIVNFEKMIKDQEHYIAFMPLLEKLSKLLDNESDFSHGIRTTFRALGRDDSDRLLGMMRSWTRLMMRGSEINLESTYSSLISKIRNNFVVSVLWGSISSMLSQFPAIGLVFNKVGLKYGTIGIARFLSSRNYRDYIRQNYIYRLSPQMQERARLEMYEMNARRKVQRGEIFKWAEKHLGEEMASMGREACMSFVDFGMKFMQDIDSYIADASWWAYFQYYSDHNEDGLTEAQIAQKATQLVMDTSSSQNIKDNALIYSSQDGAVKQLLLFTSQLNKMFNMVLSPMLDMRNYGINRQNFADLMRVLLTVGLVSAASAFAAGTAWPDDDDDEFATSVLKGTASEMAGMIPGVGSMIRDGLTGDVYASNTLPGALFNLIRVIKKDSRDRTEWQLPNAFNNVWSMTFQFLGIPNPVSKIYRAFREEDALYLINSRWGEAF